MHRALQIPEILAMVFQPFSMIQEGFGKREEDWKLCQTTLNSAARVCRIFSDPALNALWARIYSQDNLFDLISTLKKTDEGQYVSAPSTRADNLLDLVIYMNFSTWMVA